MLSGIRIHRIRECTHKVGGLVQTLENCCVYKNTSLSILMQFDAIGVQNYQAIKVIRLYAKGKRSAIQVNHKRQFCYPISPHLSRNTRKHPQYFRRYKMHLDAKET